MAVISLTNIIEISNQKRIDSEFFHTKYIQAESAVRKCNTKSLGILGDFIIGPFGSAFHVNNYDPKSKFRYIRGKDVKPFQLLDDDNVYMPEKDFLRLKRYAVKANDVIISVVGTLGNVAVIPENEEGIFSCKSTIFRDSLVDPYYLLVYLNSSYGKECLLRRQRGAIQAGLNKEDLKTIPIPIFSEEIHKKLADKIRLSIELSKQSKSLYQQATQLLEQELGLDKLKFKKEKSFRASFSEVIKEHRINAEFFYPHLKLISGHSQLHDSAPLITFFKVIRGATPKGYCTKGIKVIKTKNIRTPQIDIDRILDYVDSSKNLISLKENDLLLASMGVGSLGRMSFIDKIDDEYIVDGTIRILRKKNSIPVNYEIPTLLFLSSEIGQRLIYRGIVGSTGIISLPDEYLKKLPIPLFSEKLRNNLTVLVKESIRCKNESRQFLEQAKSEVETLIEQATN